MSDKNVDWKTKALNLLKSYYLGFGGTQWHEFNRSQDTDLLLVKIAFALFGPPTDDSEDIENAYKKEQRTRAKEILDLILKVHDDAGVSKLRVGFVFISCKQDKNEFSLPVFSVYVGEESGVDKRKYVDTQGRTYPSWTDWKDNNCLPKLEYAYPKHGYFTCSETGNYDFDPQKDPVIEYGWSPASSGLSGFLKVTDGVTAIASLGSGIIGIAACFTPLAPVVLTAAAVTGTSSAVYGATRGVGTLVDKGTHGQSLTDLESLTTWFSIIATPFHFATSLVNGALAAGAQQGRIFSSSMRMFATVLNFMTLGVDSVLFGFGLINLIKKAANNDLTALDVLQFSMSTFFFTNTLIQPKVASQIIRRAQQMHFDRMADKMTDQSAKQAFDKFLSTNNADGSIGERSRIVRTINRMQDPGKFFKAAGPDANVRIGGRKGKTVLIGDSHGHEKRVRPNEFRAMPTANTNVGGPFKFNRDYNRLKKCFGRNPEDVEMNGKKIFQNLSDRQKRTISRTVGGTAKANQDLVLTAHGIAETMGCTTSDEFMSVLEIVAKHVEGKTQGDLTIALNHIRSGQGNTAFIANLQADLSTATRIAQMGGLNFESPLTAVYHYRKHGAEFPKYINKFGNTLNVYLGPVKDHVIDGANLRETCTLQDGTVRHIYATTNDEFGVVTSTPGGAKISTMFRKPGVSADFDSQMANFFQSHDPTTPPEPISDLTANLARHLGFRGFTVVLWVNGKKQKIEECLDLDQDVHQHIAQLLMALDNE